MKHLLFTLASSLLLLFTSCSDDAKVAFLPKLPATSGANLKSLTHSSNYKDSYNWAFTYSNDRLTQATGTLNSSSSVSPSYATYSVNISYGSNTVGFSLSNGKKMTATLNTSHLISTMSIGNNNYTFTYDNNQLIRWKKETLDEATGRVSNRSYANITYSGKNFQQIDYVENENAPKNKVTLTFTTSSQRNINGLLPEYVVNEMGLSGFEYLYYAGLLGQAVAYLPADVTYSYAEYPEKDFTMSFTYGSDSNTGNTVVCYFNNGNPLTANYGY